MCRKIGNRRWRDLLERYHKLVRNEIMRFRGQEMDTAGDGFFAIFDGPARAIRCACSIRNVVSQIGISVRAGLHTGECEMLADKVSGIAVHIGARVMNKAGSGEVLVSSTVKDLVAGSDIRFIDRDVHTLRNIPGEWHLYSVNYQYPDA